MLHRTGSKNTEAARRSGISANFIVPTHMWREAKLLLQR
jgi:hypothetical protein